MAATGQAVIFGPQTAGGPPLPLSGVLGSHPMLDLQWESTRVADEILAAYEHDRAAKLADAIIQRL